MERHLDSAAVRDVTRDPALRRELSRQLGESMILWRSEIWVNRAGERPIAAWHHDAYPRLLKGEGVSLNAYIALTDVDHDNGFEYLPRSAEGNEGRRVIRTDPFSGNQFFEYPAEVEQTAAPVCLNAGEFILFSNDLIHRSVRNTSEQTRVALTIRVTTPAVRPQRGYTTDFKPVRL